jgi:uncharacterized repeat protein (TIGR02543 family)
MKSKKYLFVLLLVIVLLAGGCFKKPDNQNNNNNEPTPEVKEKVTITFDTDGGNTISSMTVEKGSTIELPTPQKEDAEFLGWYIGEEAVDNTKKYDEDTTLKAKWNEKKKEPEKTYFTVTFDSKGGSKVSSIKVECGKELRLPKNPTKTGYTFLNWSDKNGHPIYDKALLYCDDVTVYATWEEVKKEFECPAGYKLNGTKCTIEEAAKTKCDGERVFEYEGKCVTITGTVRKDTQRSCPKEHITYMSSAGLEEGKVVNWGVIGCAYHKTNDTKDACESHGFKWVTPESACYVKWISNNTINTCDHLSNYAYITNPNSYQGVNGLNGGCFPLKEKTKYCSDGYTLSGDKCTKTINATEKK